MNTEKAYQDILQAHQDNLRAFSAAVAAFRECLANTAAQLDMLQGTVKGVVAKAGMDDAAGVEPACARVQSPAGMPTTHASPNPKVCALIHPSPDKRIGGPRSICMKPRGHAPPCGHWKRVGQYEHAHINDDRG